MANWLSTRLKAAEQFLQQIDQQAAETLKKQDKIREQDSSEYRSSEIKQTVNGHPFHSEKGNGFHNQERLSDRHSQSTSFVDRNFFSDHDSSSKQPTPITYKPFSSPSQYEFRNFGRDDWTELLGSADLNLPSSASRTSVGIRSNDVDGSSSSGKGSWAKTSPRKGQLYSTTGLSNASRSISGGETSGIYPAKTLSQTSSINMSVPVAQVLQSSMSERANMASDFQGETNTSKDVFANEMNQITSAGDAGVVLQGEISTVEDNLKQDNDMSSAKQESSGKNAAKLDVEIALEMQKYSESFLDKVDLTIQTAEAERHIENWTAQVSGSRVRDRNEENVSEHEGVLATVSEVSGQRSTEGADEVSRIVLLSETLESLDKGGGFLLEDQQHFWQTADRGRQEFTGVHDKSDPPVGANFSRISLESSQDVRTNGRVTTCAVHNSSRSDSSETDGDSSSDSEYEEGAAGRMSKSRRLELRKSIEAAAAAEAAEVAIKKREQLVYELEQEHQTLQRILAEEEAKSIQEEAELRASVLECTRLLELERQSHQETRLQGLELETKLEAENAELARALAASQRDLEKELARVAKARSAVESKGAAVEKLERELAQVRWKLSSPTQAPLSLNNDNVQIENLEQEKLKLIEKIEHYRMHIAELEEKHKRMLDRQLTPSKHQLELEAQLTQVTDSLIRKQAQVEDLSTEKATLLFRVEAATNKLREAKLGATKRSKGAGWTNWATDEDLEDGLSKPYSAKAKRWEIRSLSDSRGVDAFLNIVRHFDSVFAGVTYILRRHSIARALAVIYLLSVHWWVLFILIFHSSAAPESNTGTVGKVGFVDQNLTQSTSTQNVTSFL